MKKELKKLPYVEHNAKPYVDFFYAEGYNYERKEFTKNEWKVLKAYCPDKISPNFQTWKNDMEAYQNADATIKEAYNKTVQSVTILPELESEIRKKVESRKDFIGWSYPQQTVDTLFKKLIVAKHALKTIETGEGLSHSTEDTYRLSEREYAKQSLKTIDEV